MHTCTRLVLIYMQILSGGGNIIYLNNTTTIIRHAFDVNEKIVVQFPTKCCERRITIKHGVSRDMHVY